MKEKTGFKSKKFYMLRKWKTRKSLPTTEIRKQNASEESSCRTRGRMGNLQRILGQKHVPPNTINDFIF